MKTGLLLLILAGFASAQPKLADMAVLIFTEVAPTMVEQYQTHAATVSDAYKKAGLPFRMHYQSLFGRGLSFLSTIPVTEMASWESGTDLEKRMGTAAYQKWLPEYRKTITGATRLFVRPIPENTIQDTPVGSLPIMVMQRTRVEFSRRSEFETRNRTLVIPALKKAGVKRYVLSRVVFGGHSNEYITARLHAGLADAEKANQVIAGIPIPAGLVLSSERTMYRVNPKASFAQGVVIR